MAAASSAAACSPLELAAGPTSPKSSGGSRPSRLRTRKKTDGRVHWDEQVIEEHNKERGTRQKIDEPDTPFVRSPQTASDSEGGPASSDDEHRLSFRASPEAGPSAAEPPALQEQAQQVDVDPLALASRLDNWVRSGGNHRRPSTASSVASSDGLEADVEYSRVSSGCSSRSSSSAPQRRLAAEGPQDHGPKTNRRISLSADAGQPKPTSDFFKAKRAQHYNEVAAMRAFKKTPSRESSPESDTSEEQEETTKTKTNTNTNINQTVSKHLEPLESRPRQPSSGGGSDRESRDCAEPRDRVVVFSGESGGESSEEFRSLRHSHYSHEWRQDPAVPLEMSSLETNTNTNLNAVSKADVCNKSDKGRAKNPMEAARPPVQFDAETGDAASSSQEFRAKRNQHYDEFKAVRQFKSESRDEELNGSECSDDAPREADTVANPANPMEPREAQVAFQVGGSTSATGGPDGRQGVQDQGGSEATTEEDWRARRQAHYSEMAAALRAMPPPSDDEDDDDDEDDEDAK